MATVSAVILKNHKKQDGTWNVKIRITNNGKSAYIETTYYVVKSNLDTKLRLKKVFIDTYLTATLNQYRSEINKLGAKVSYMYPNEIREHLLKDDKVVDFFEYCTIYIKDLIEGPRKSTGLKRQTSFRVFKKFTKKESLPTDLLTSKMLKEFEMFLRKEKYSVNTIRNIMADLSAMFNAAKYEHNDEELGIIKIHNSPFSRYTIPKKLESKKKARDVEFLKKFRDMEFESHILRDARDLFMLSFYMCGTNMVDFHRYLTDPNIDSFEYNRSKTKDKREDAAFISIKVIPEAKELIKKFAGTIQKRFKTQRGLNNLVWDAFKNELPKLSKIDDLTFYDARHSFATLARRCGFSIEDVGNALNHKRSTITNDYIKEDWTLIDNVQRKVVDLLK